LVITSERVLIYNPDGDKLSNIILKYPQISKAEFKDVSGRRVIISSGQKTITMNANKPAKEEIRRCIKVMEEGPEYLKVESENEALDQSIETENSSNLTDSLKFRGVQWRASEKEIIESEGRKPDRRSKEGSLTTLIYIDNIRSIKMAATYILVDNELSHANYESQEIFEKNDAHRKFNSLKELFESKYGAPSQEESAQNEELMRKTGYSRVLNWEAANTGISLALSYNTGTYQIQIIYQNDNLYHKANSALKENDSGKI
jgi:hypothetical protein